MKYVVVKYWNNWRFIDHSVNYDDLPKNESIFDHIRTLPHLGMLMGLEADFRVIPQTYVRGFSLDEYDVIVKLDPLPNLRRKRGQKIIYVPVEPNLRRVNPEVYDVMLDNYRTPMGLELAKMSRGWRHPKPVVSFLYRYPIDLMRKHIKPKLDPPCVFIQKRTSLRKEPECARGESGHMGRSYRDFFKYLSQCKYLFNLCDNKASGQIIAEAAILGVVSFARDSKAFQRLLFPEACSASSEKDLWHRYETFEKYPRNHELCLEMATEMVNKHLDYKGLDRWFEENVIPLT